MKLRLAILLSITLFVDNASAAETKPAAKSATAKSPQTISQEVKLPEMIQYAHDLMDSFRHKCPDCDAFSAGEATPSDASDPKTICSKAWADFYSKDKIDIRIAFGFIDSETSKKSDDSLLRAVLIEQLIRPCVRRLPECAGAKAANNPDLCESNVRACDFKRSDSDMNLFTKEIVGPSGRTHTVELRITGSSSDEGPSAQARASQEAEKFFHSALREADVVLYAGHARKGGGPSFAPAARRANGSIAYEEYQRDRSGYDKMLAALQTASRPPKIVGILACDAANYFRTGMIRTAPQTGLLLASAADTDRSLLTRAYFALDSILWARCQGGFNESLNTMKDFDGYRLTPMVLDRFFEAYKPSL